MKIKYFPVILIFITFLGKTTQVTAQLYHEVGVMVGPVSFRGDYGERGEIDAITNNIGFGFGVNHYLNFAFTDFSKREIRRHVKVRSSLIYHSTSLNHFGPTASLPNEEGEKLRSMFGEANVLELGSGLEYYLMRIRDFERNPGAFTPYVGVGLNLVFYSPVAGTSFEDGLGLEETTFRTFLADPGEEPAFTNKSNVTISANFQGGVKYKITRSSDLIFELRWHYYFSDLVDGLEPIGPQNKNNDWMFWLTFGYIYNLD